MKGSYIDYSMSVIVARALPDVRDGLKPVHRRVLYGMQELGLAANRPYKKSARIVGEVLGKYHPHGDTAVYDTMVRMAQDFSMRYPLVDGQGNFGSVDGDSPAAMRYTEARLSRIAEEMLRDLEKNTVDFVPNFDDTLKEPSVLPALVPNLLVNGTSGIAVGMATNIPPHNLTEVIDGCIALIDDETAHRREADEVRQGARFPDRRHHLRLRRGQGAPTPPGAGRIVVRAKASIETGKNDRQSIVVTEIPYQVNKANLIEKIADLVQREEARGHLRHPRRVGPRRHADRHRAEARRQRRGHPEQSVQAHADADDLRRDHAGAGGRAAAGPDAEGDDADTSSSTGTRWLCGGRSSSWTRRRNARTSSRATSSRSTTSTRSSS